MKEKDLRLKIISELVDLHSKTGYKSEELDEEILQSVADSEFSREELEAIRNEMWVEYTRLLLENIDSLLSDLLKNFVEIEKIRAFHVKFNELQGRHEETDFSTDINKIKDLFDECFTLYKNIRKEERILKRSGIERFRLKIFPIYFGILSTFYGAFQYFYLKLDIFTAIGIWILLLIVYFLLKWWWRKGL